MRPMREDAARSARKPASCWIAIFDVPPLRPEQDGAAEALARRLTGDNGTHVVSYGTEAGQFQAAGYSAVVCGPGDIAQAHQADEFIELSRVQGRAGLHAAAGGRAGMSFPITERQPAPLSRAAARRLRRGGDRRRDHRGDDRMASGRTRAVGDGLRKGPDRGRAEQPQLGLDPPAGPRSGRTADHGGKPAPSGNAWRRNSATRWGSGRPA